MLLLFISPIFAQTAAQERTKIIFPSAGIAFAGGYEIGDLNGLDLDGANLQVRGIYIPKNVYPVIALGIDTEFSFLQLDDQNTDFDGTNISVGAVFGLVLPFYLLSEKIPLGAGLPVYAAYNFYDRLSFSDSDLELEGQSLKIGVALPIPLKTSLLIAAQIQYETYFYSDEDKQAFATSFQTNDLDRSAWKFRLQVGIPLTK